MQRAKKRHLTVSPLTAYDLEQAVAPAHEADIQSNEAPGYRSFDSAVTREMPGDN